MKLRDYQEIQVKFLNDFTSKESGKLFDENISLESPTGSGKTIVMLYFIKQYFRTHNNTKIFISTGFNNLVHQFYDEALDMGIPVRKFIGKNNCSCVKKINDDLEEDYKFGYVDTKTDKFIVTSKNNFPKTEVTFSKEQLYCPSSSDCYDCKENMTSGSVCLYNLNKEEIKQANNMLVITNHSTLIARADFFNNEFIGGFIDECQSFGDFYESALRIEITPGEIYSLLNSLKRDGLLKDSLQKTLIGNAIRKGSLTSNLLYKTLKLNSSTYPYPELGKMHPNLATKVSEWNETAPSKSNYFHPQIEDNRFNGVVIDRFFDKVDFLGVKCCLVSATVDKYTKSIFNIKERNCYKETSCSITDYKKSNVFIYNTFNDNYVRGFLNTQYAKHGLLLSTRVDIVEEYINKKEFCGYEIIDKVTSFIPGKKQILVGSKSLFQGIDIEDIGFVLINKLPFSRYDESYKKKMSYLDSLGHNSYNYYSIPYTTNQLTQAMGRLWRKPGDYGNVAIFDERCKDKHKNILLDSCSYREGINIFYM